MNCRKFNDTVNRDSDTFKVKVKTLINLCYNFKNYLILRKTPIPEMVVDVICHL